MMNVVRSVAKILVLLALSLCLNSGEVSAQAGLGGPEDARIGCQVARHCPTPQAQPGQDPRCVQAACVNNLCVKAIATGRQLGVEPAGNLACYARPLICDADGKAIPDPDPSKYIAQNEGQVCVYTSTLPTCSIARCRNKQCVQENNDGAACTNAPLTACQKGVCQGGFCSAIADPQKAGTQCRAPQTTGCVTMEYQCTSTGVCNTKNTVAAGKQCAPGVGYNSNQAYLPSAFTSLFSKSSTPPQYGCTSSCTLQYCGDNIVQPALGEQCDTTVSGKPNATCTQCKITCAAGSSMDRLGQCCPASQKDARNTCCPAGKTPSCGRCDGCQSCPTERCRFGGNWPMNHLAPGCAPWANWHPVGRLDFWHGQQFWKVHLLADANSVGFQSRVPCINRPNSECRDYGKSGWIYTTNPNGELITDGEWATRMPCTCDNGTISCSCNTGQYRDCIAFNSVGCTVGGYNGLAGIRHLPGSGFSGNATASHCVYPQGNGCIFCGLARPLAQGCFDPDTEILLEEGVVKRANEIRVGDKIYNPLTRGSREVKKVLQGPEKEPMYEFGFDGYLLKVTRTHPVLTTTGMKRAKDIVVGDVVYDAFGEEHEITYARTAEYNPTQRVFNFELATESDEYMERLIVGGNIVSGDLHVQNAPIEGE